MHTQRIALAGLIAFFVSVGQLHAQGERKDVHIRNDCRRAAQVLRTGNPAPHWDWALEYIARCEETGPTTLATLWRQPMSEVTTGEGLFIASYRLRDARLTETLLDVAADRSVPQPVRLNAIRVIAGHAVPEFLLSISDLSRPDSETRRVSFPSVDHVSVRDGDVRVGSGTIRSIIIALARLSQDADPQVALAASRTHREICGRLTEEVCR